MTTREKAHRLLDQLSEANLEAEYQRLRAAVEFEQVDEWGDVSAFARASSASVFKRLDEEEARVGFSWGQYR